MKVMRGLEGIGPHGPSSVTIGTFDGVHRGHRALIKATTDDASERGLASGAVTWDRHPLTTLRPDRAPLLLTNTDRKLELLEEAGLDWVAVLAFDEALSHWPPERFAELLAR